MNYREYKIQIQEDTQFGNLLQERLPETYGRLKEANDAARALQFLFPDLKFARLSRLNTVKDFEL